MYVYCSRLHSKSNHLLKNQKLYHSGRNSISSFAVITNENFVHIHIRIFIFVGLIVILSIGMASFQKLFISIFLNQLKCKWMLRMTSFRFYIYYYCKFSSWNRKSFAAYYILHLYGMHVPSIEHMNDDNALNWIANKIDTFVFGSTKHRAHSNTIQLTAGRYENIHIEPSIWRPFWFYK